MPVEDAESLLRLENLRLVRRALAGGFESRQFRLIDLSGMPMAFLDLARTCLRCANLTGANLSGRTSPAPT